MNPGCEARRNWAKPRTRTEAIFDVLTRQDGLNLASLEQEREEGVLRIEDAIEPPIAPLLDSQATIAERQPADSAVVERFPGTNEPVGLGQPDREQLQRLVSEGRLEMTLASLLPGHRLPYLYPDYPLEMALRYVDQTPLIPVISRADLRKREGIITSEDVLARYRVAAGAG